MQHRYSPSLVSASPLRLLAILKATPKPIELTRRHAYYSQLGRTLVAHLQKGAESLLRHHTPFTPPY